MSTITAIATSATTSAPRRRRRGEVVSVPRAASPRADCGSALDCRRAGNSPTRTPVTSASAAAKIMTLASIRAVSRRGMFPGLSESSNCRPAAATPSPSAVPAVVSTSVSTRSCWTSRRRLAPRAARTASSRRRDAPRASMRFATLVQAMSNTHATAPNSTIKPRRTSPIICSVSDMDPSRQVTFGSAYRSGNRVLNPSPTLSRSA